MNLVGIDIVFSVLIFLLFLRGFLRGFIRELLSWASLVLGILGSVLFYKNGAIFIRDRFLPGMKILPEILAFIAIFVIVFLVLKILGKILRDIVEGIHLGGVDKFLGAAFGLVEGLVLVSLVLFILTIQPLFDPTGILGSSLFAQFLLPLIFASPAAGVTV
jgi:membrane protein required for colicin V production